MKLKEKIKEILKNPYFNWGLFVLAILFAIYLSSSSEAVPGPLKGSRIGHFFEYAAISLLLFRAFYSSKVKNEWVYAVIFTIIIGFIDEVYQGYFVPGRLFQWGDVLANSLGAFFVQFLGKIKTLFLR
jgi:VanZ family protein